MGHDKLRYCDGGGDIWDFMMLAKCLDGNIWHVKFRDMTDWVVLFGT